MLAKASSLSELAFSRSNITPMIQSSSKCKRAKLANDPALFRSPLVDRHVCCYRNPITYPKRNKDAIEMTLEYPIGGGRRTRFTFNFKHRA